MYDKEKIVLPKNLQEKMLAFFIKTSIPRQIIQKKETPVYKKDR